MHSRWGCPHFVLHATACETTVVGRLAFHFVHRGSLAMPKKESGEAWARENSNRRTAMALRGGGTRAHADDRHSTSEEADEADMISPARLARGARSQLRLVLRTINTSSELLEANDAMRAVPEALVRSSAAAYTAMRAAPAIFTR